MQKSSKNICKGSDERDKEIDSDEGGLKGRKTPTAAGVDSSKSLSSYEKSASGKVCRDFHGFTIYISCCISILTMDNADHELAAEPNHNQQPARCDGVYLPLEYRRLS